MFGRQSLSCRTLSHIGEGAERVGASGCVSAVHSRSVSGKRVSWVACAAVLAVASGCGDDAHAGLFGGCLSDQQICQFQKDVSTKMDVMNALGNAQAYLISNTWAYYCQEVAGGVPIHNDITVFDFRDSG